MKSTIFTATVLFTVFVSITTIHAQQALGDTLFLNIDSLKLQNPDFPDYMFEDLSEGLVLLDTTKKFYHPVAYKQIYLLDGKLVSPLIQTDTTANYRTAVTHAQKIAISMYGEKARQGIMIYESKNKEDRFSLTGKIDSYYNGCPVMLFTFKDGKINDDRIHTVDTAMVRNGEFYFRGKEYLADEAIVTAGNYPEKTKACYVILERGNIKIDMRDSSTHAHACGTPLNDTLAAYYKEMHEYDHHKFSKLQSDLDKKLITEEQHKKASDDLIQEKYLTRANYVRRNHSNVVGEIIFKKHVLNGNLAVFPFFDEIYSSMSERVKADPDVVSSIKRRDRDEIKEEQRNQNIGQTYTDFEFQTVTGEKRSLSEFVGKSKYLLIEFWASWCGPCIEEIPHLKKVYEKYKGRGLEVVAISLDNQNDAWQKALKKVNAPWTQLCIKEDNNTNLLYNTYHFSGIPYSILLDENGKIIANDLRFSKMDTPALDSLFK